MLSISTAVWGSTDIALAVLWTGRPFQLPIWWEDTPTSSVMFICWGLTTTGNRQKLAQSRSRRSERSSEIKAPCCCLLQPPEDKGYKPPGAGCGEWGLEPSAAEGNTRNKLEGVFSFSKSKRTEPRHHKSGKWGGEDGEPKCYLLFLQRKCPPPLPQNVSPLQMRKPIHTTACKCCKMANFLGPEQGPLPSSTLFMQQKSTLFHRGSCATLHLNTNLGTTNMAQHIKQFEPQTGSNF